MATTYVGKQVTIKAGTRVTYQGRIRARKNDSVVTVRASQPARNGKTKITWKSHGYAATALV